MPYARHYVGPPWPPDPRDYTYVLMLSCSDLAWEFLRRNPDYQCDYQLSRNSLSRPRMLNSGVRMLRLGRADRGALAWGLHPFCGSGAAGARGPPLLAGMPRGPRARRRHRVRG